MLTLQINNSFQSYSCHSELEASDEDFEVLSLNVKGLLGWLGARGRRGLGKHFYLQMRLLLPLLLQHIYSTLRPNRLPCHSELETSDEDAEVPNLIAEDLLGRPGFEGWLCNSKKTEDATAQSTLTQHCAPTRAEPPCTLQARRSICQPRVLSPPPLKRKLAKTATHINH